MRVYKIADLLSVFWFSEETVIYLPYCSSSEWTLRGLASTGCPEFNRNAWEVDEKKDLNVLKIFILTAVFRSAISSVGNTIYQNPPGLLLVPHRGLGSIYLGFTICRWFYKTLTNQHVLLLLKYTWLTQTETVCPRSNQVWFYSVILSYIFILSFYKGHPADFPPKQDFIVFLLAGRICLWATHDHSSHL